jgi:CheY-like chemotaxis protein
MARPDLRPILLVEDNEDDVLLFQWALKKAGLSNPVQVVCGVASGKAYLDGDGVFADRGIYPFPSVLVVDLKLRDGNGMEFLGWVGSEPKFRDLHRIVLTGDERISTLQKCYAAGADSFLRKPCSEADLRNIAEGYAKHWRA